MGKKTGHKKHKYDFFIMLHDWLIAYWVVVVICLVCYDMQSHRPGVAAIRGILLMVFIGLGEGGRRQSLVYEKDGYDQIFARRKNPEIYNSMKEITALLFETGWGHRKFLIAFNIVLLVFVSFGQPPIFFPAIIFSLLQLYQSYIFDFDEPEKKDKKVTDSVTDIVFGAWKNLIGGLVPKGV